MTITSCKINLLHRSLYFTHKKNPTRDEACDKVLGEKTVIFGEIFFQKNFSHFASMKGKYMTDKNNTNELQGVFHEAVSLTNKLLEDVSPKKHSLIPLNVRMDGMLALQVVREMASG